MVIVVANRKGGVGKTTSVLNLGVAFAELGYRVVQVGFDPQGDLQSRWGIDDEERVLRVEDLLADPRLDPADALRDFTPEGMTGRVLVLPAGDDLAAHTAPLAKAPGELARITEALLPPDDGDEGQGLADIVIVDTPSTKTVFTEVALKAADAVVVIMEPRWDANRQAQKLIKRLDEGVTNTRRRRVELAAVLFTQSAKRLKLFRRYAAHMRVVERGSDSVEIEAGVRVLRSVIPSSKEVEEHAELGSATMLLKPDGKVAQGYRKAAEELVEILVGEGE